MKFYLRSVAEEVLRNDAVYCYDCSLRRRLAEAAADPDLHARRIALQCTSWSCIECWEPKFGDWETAIKGWMFAFAEGVLINGVAIPCAVLCPSCAVMGDKAVLQIDAAAMLLKAVPTTEPQ